MNLRPRLFSILLAAALCAAPLLRAGDLEITRLWTGHRDAESSVRISEYFGRDEGGRQTIFLRSQPDDRTGFYLTVRLKAAHGKVLADGKVIARIIAPDAAEPRIFEFPYSPAGQRTVCLQVGVTGTDWPYGNVLPMAWKLEIVDASGAVLDSRQSFLWEKPAAGTE